MLKFICFAALCAITAAADATTWEFRDTIAVNGNYPRSPAGEPLWPIFGRFVENAGQITSWAIFSGVGSLERYQPLPCYTGTERTPVPCPDTAVENSPTSIEFVTKVTHSPGGETRLFLRLVTPIDSGASSIALVPGKISAGNDFTGSIFQSNAFNSPVYVALLKGTITALPEPGSLAIMAVGAGLVLWLLAVRPVHELR